MVDAPVPEWAFVHRKALASGSGLPVSRVFSALSGIDVAFNAEFSSNADDLCRDEQGIGRVSE
ncbi:hypothetical protein MUG10_15585 [Xanthomonas prunicola]|jgi:hypothetical protein|uniref:Uncharacterized protein n=1 Tax=Xanthomonas prunicola TaxID=2053930 RepID=A0A9Q9J106_9XANT|nr:hypothetical protein [Xanthomonas prunicola]USI99470.1 hypothetical protein MUG10_15585 [Xanthomonas prunicola]UXA47924.1 hypothetical protein M0D44_16570 [Xanthomonas prunicola]UXA54239.1 hypothetical protein M0D45_05725 [Xanthomonas prunicola]UXA56387.1 hypothetical protein M0D47_16520 [Xanthomonas prunicola]UXA62340.1 hypothetical protein M0D48_04890 [Xanthomonas prunicola]